MGLIAGSNDCKNNLIGILEAFEILLEMGFHPQRRIVAAFGFDEEIRSCSLQILTCSGPQGANYISRHLLEQYGKDSFEFILDEGGSEIKDLYGGTFALPGTAEKVY